MARRRRETLFKVLNRRKQRKIQEFKTWELTE